MSSPGKYIAAGVFIGLLMFKPSFGIVLGRTIGELSVAAFENNQPTPPQPQVIPVADTQPLPNRADDSEEHEAIFSAIAKILERLEQLEIGGKTKVPEEEDEIPRFSDKEQPSEALKDMPDRERTNSSELMDPKRFDQEFNKKFKVSQR